jgi:2-polyprenyl-3-methyl-5-hydroxy-6-metoxy-1,4-benzoquinol methylase
VTSSSDAFDFAHHTCTAPAERADRMRDIVVAEAPRGPIRVLDLGCGTGALSRRIADALPDASVVGIDVSPANVEAARRSDASVGRRVQFEVADYRTFSAPPFDLIVTDGVLHLVPGDTTALVQKLARDVRAGGVLVCAMPYACVYNTVFAGVRRVLSAIRGSWTDRLILQSARVWHGSDMDDAGLRERVEYMYLPPERVMDARVARLFAAAGLRQRREYPATSTSPSQLRHRITVFERATTDR